MAVWRGAVAQIGLQHAPFGEDAGVIGEQAKQQPDQQPLQRGAVVGGLERVVQLAHQFGSDDVDRVLVMEDPFFDPDDEAEGLNVRGQFGESEAGLLAGVEVD